MIHIFSTDDFLKPWFCYLASPWCKRTKRWFLHQSMDLLLSEPPSNNLITGTPFAWNLFRPAASPQHDSSVWFSAPHGEPNGHAGSVRLAHSLPGSPADRKPTPFEVVGSAESLVGRVLAEQGLGKYCDTDFVRYTSKEMQEALDMTQEEMDRAAHHLLLQERRITPTGLPAEALQSQL